MEPTNVDVPAFHEGFSDLVALLLHFTYADVVERALRDSRWNLNGLSLLTDIAREFGYARARKGAPSALRSGVDVEGIAAFDSDVPPSDKEGPRAYDPKLEAHALWSSSSPRCSRRSSRSSAENAIACSRLRGWILRHSATRV
ncbi:MAG: hypothetical protein H0U94_09580 [Acidobacteria bacterium]|nr:hypothetical protein [Acidobacteriota bacterium]